MASTTAPLLPRDALAAMQGAGPLRQESTQCREDLRRPLWVMEAYNMHRVIPFSTLNPLLFTSDASAYETHCTTETGSRGVKMNPKTYLAGVLYSKKSLIESQPLMKCMMVLQMMGLQDAQLTTTCSCVSAFSRGLSDRGSTNNGILQSCFHVYLQ